MNKMKQEKTLSEEIEYKNEISPDFIGDNPETMKEGTITPIGYIKVEKVKQKFKEILDEIEEEIKKYEEKVDYTESGILYSGVSSGLEKAKQIIKQKAGDLVE